MSPGKFLRDRLDLFAVLTKDTDAIRRVGAGIHQTGLVHRDTSMSRPDRRLAVELSPARNILKKKIDKLPSGKPSIKLYYLLFLQLETKKLE